MWVHAPAIAYSLDANCICEEQGQVEEGQTARGDAAIRPVSRGRYDGRCLDLLSLGSNVRFSSEYFSGWDRLTDVIG